MWEEKEKGQWPIRLVLNSKASNILDFHTRHYSGRGLMKKMSGAQLAKEIGCGEDGLQKSFTNYNNIAEGKEKDIWGKKYFHNLPFNVDDEFHVAEMEPVLHFTMGGIEINDKAQCLNSEGKPFEGLFICGELAGGVHGANRLGGSSLLGCVVYGRVAGESASKFMFQEVLNGGMSAAAQRLGQISLHIDPNTPGKISVEWANNGGASASDAPESHTQSSSAPVMSSKADSSDPAKVSSGNKLEEFKVPEKEYSLEEVAKHNSKEDLWIAVKGVVMNVTDWVDEVSCSYHRFLHEMLTHDSTPVAPKPSSHTWARTPQRSSPCCTTTRSSPSTLRISVSVVSRGRRSPLSTRRSLLRLSFLGCNVLKVANQSIWSSEAGITVSCVLHHLCGALQD